MVPATALPEFSMSRMPIPSGDSGCSVPLFWLELAVEPVGIIGWSEDHTRGAVIDSSAFFSSIAFTFRAWTCSAVRGVNLKSSGSRVFPLWALNSRMRSPFWRGRWGSENGVGRCPLDAYPLGDGEVHRDLAPEEARHLFQDVGGRRSWRGCIGRRVGRRRGTLLRPRPFFRATPHLLGPEGRVARVDPRHETLPTVRPGSGAPSRRAGLDVLIKEDARHRRVAPGPAVHFTHLATALAWEREKPSRRRGLRNRHLANREEWGRGAIRSSGGRFSSEACRIFTECRSRLACAAPVPASRAMARTRP